MRKTDGREGKISGDFAPEIVLYGHPRGMRTPAREPLLI
jgi:hypothetical protein